METDDNNNGFDILQADPSPATTEWCYRLRMIALDRALKTLEGAKISASDMVSLMKIRRSLEDEVGEKPQIVWQDPPHWNRVTKSAEPDPAS